MVYKKCSKELYCQFLIAAQNNFTATNFASLIEGIAHDSITRFLSRTKLTPKILWEYSKLFVDLESGYLICDDTVLDHWYGENIELAKWQYSGTHHKVVYGIGLTTLLWTDALGQKHIPVDFRVYAKSQDGCTKNEHFREMLVLAKHKRFVPEYVIFDSWYSTIKTLHLINDWKWKFVCGLQSNRSVSEAKGNPYQKLSKVNISEEGNILHLKDFGSIKVFCIIAKKGKVQYLVTNDFSLTFQDIQDVAARRWKVEEYHRGLKQISGVEMCQSRTGRSQRTHIFCSILTFLALEKKRIEEGITWYEAKRKIISDALFSYLSSPTILLPVPAG